MRKKICCNILFLSFFIFFSSSEGKISNISKKELSQAQDVWKLLSVQHQGRIKPFDTFAREILRKVYGKETYQKRSAVEVILSWLIIPDFWENTKVILIEQKDIKQSLNLPVKTKRFSPSELASNQKLALQLVELKSLKQKKERLDTYFQKLEKLETKLILYIAVKTGFLIRLEPQGDSKTWLSLPEMTKPAEEQFGKLISSYVRLISKNVSSSLLSKDSSLGKNSTTALNLAQEDKTPNSSQNNNKSSFGRKSIYEKQSQNDKAFLLQDKNFKFLQNKSPFKQKEDSIKKESLSQTNLFSAFEKEMKKFQNLVFKEKTFQPLKLRAEIFYNSFKAFQKAWVFYFLFLLACLALYTIKQPHLFKWIIPLAAMGFASHSLGMLLRSYIMSRPPVSNMYETVVWVPWVALIAGFIFYLRGSKIPFIAGVLLSCFCLLLTSLAPEILDGSLQPLEAVLNSSFWLSTHVLIITMSYSFFFLAFVLGDMALVSYLINKSQPLDLIKKMYNPIYRSIQWGVVFLAGGTILGGIWADYSWGRFWGWDPKESWALVSLLAYLALLHGRLTKWINPFGMAIGSVMMFFSVIMAWYGVNFVLGAGLHSYGFGTGGVEYVFAFLLLHMLLCGLAVFKNFQLKRS